MYRILTIPFCIAFYCLKISGQAYTSKNLPFEEKIFILSEIWTEVKYNFCNPQKLFDIKWDSLYKSNIKELAKIKSDYEFYQLLQKFIAKIGDGHTSIDLGDIEENFKQGQLPILIQAVAGKYYLFAFINEYNKEVPLGSEVEKIDNLPVQKYMDKFVLNP